MKHLVLYHANCTDGFGAAFAAWLKLGDDAEYVPMNYLPNDLSPSEAWEQLSQRIPSKMNTDREVYILDFSLPKPVMDKLMEVSGKVVWLDHHKTAFEMWCEDGERNRCEQSNGRDYVLLDNNKSGAYLAWEYFHPETPVPLLIRHIDDRDRWQFKIDGTREFNAALRSMEPWSFEQWQRLCFSEVEYLGLISAGEGILRAHDQHVQSIAQGAKDCWIKGPTIELPGSFLDGVVRGWDGGKVVNCPPAFTSDVGHKLAKDCGTYGLMWHTVDGVEARCSLRSDGDYDVSAIAKQFGGGGHKNAAGFSVPLQALLSWYKN